uniref:BOS complex subunit NCLN n=1 Tax=Knipowitschia caucasica TaxID=637954 RepID=A0AAV2M5H2_KNICA
MEQTDRFQVPPGNGDPLEARTSSFEATDSKSETVALSYKPSPLQVQIEKHRDLARKASVKSSSGGSPVNQQPKKTARSRLVVPNKGYSSLDQNPDETPLVALDTDSDEDLDVSRYSSSGYSSAEQINQDLNIQLLKDGYRLDEIPDDEDLDLIPPKSVSATCDMRAVVILLMGVLLKGSVSSYEFTAFRMQQYDLGKYKYGCRSALVSSAAVVSALDSSFSRRCVLMGAEEVTWSLVKEAQTNNAAAILILLPKNMSSMSEEARQSFMEAEVQLLQKEVQTPVYVAPEDDHLLLMREELQENQASKSSSLLHQVFRSLVTSTSFQVIVSNNGPIRPTKETTVYSLEGCLHGAGEDPPTIVITAHYDSFGLAPWLSYGADSNASGVTLLLELMRLFRKLYNDQRNRPQFNLLFALTGGGKFNFIGTKRWIEENLDHAESSLLQDVALVLCLDTLGAGQQMFAHVSRPPRPESPLWKFTQVLDEVVQSRFPSWSFSSLHKKINLGESSVSWEHERFSVRRISALSLSHLRGGERGEREGRGSVLDTMSSVDLRSLRTNGLIIAEALGRLMFNLSHLGSPKEVQLFRGQLDWSDSRVSSILTLLTSVPRPAQFWDQDPDQAMVLDSVEQEFRVRLKEVKRFEFKMDWREPEISFFDQMKQNIIVYRVKPAAFDLFVGGCVAVYLGLVYIGVQTLDPLYSGLKAAVKGRTL